MAISRIQSHSYFCVPEPMRKMSSVVQKTVAAVAAFFAIYVIRFIQAAVLAISMGRVGLWPFKNSKLDESTAPSGFIPPAPPVPLLQAPPAPPVPPPGSKIPSAHSRVIVPASHSRTAVPLRPQPPIRSGGDLYTELQQKLQKRKEKAAAAASSGENDPQTPAATPSRGGDRDKTPTSWGSSGGRPRVRGRTRNRQSMGMSARQLLINLNLSGGLHRKGEDQGGGAS